VENRSVHIVEDPRSNVETSPVPFPRLEDEIKIEKLTDKMRDKGIIP
jgi:hypothetical protein